MSDLDDLEEMAAQTTIVVNSRGGRGRRAGTLTVSPGMANAHVARDRKPPPAPVAASKPAPLPEIIMVADRGEVIATVRRHQDIVEVFRLMRQRLGLTNEFIDDVGGLTKGHTDKILGPSESKSWGPTTFDLFCEMFAIEFRVHIDLAAVQRMEAVWEGHERPRWFPPEKMNSRISQKLIERAKPHVIKDFSRAGGLASGRLRSGSQGSEIMRKLAKSGWRKRKKAGALLKSQGAPS